MRQALIASTIFVISIAFIGCQSGASSSNKELDRPTALAMATAQIQVPVTFSVPRENHYNGDYLKYQPAVQAGIISCQSRYAILEATGQPRLDSFAYYNCQPGANSVGITAVDNNLVLTPGYKIPREVTGISKVDQSTAIVDITIGYNDSQGFMAYYTKNTQQLDPIFGHIFSKPYNHYYFDEPRRAIFKLYDDGWRIEQRIQ